MNDLATTREPSPKEVRDLLEGLLGRDVTVEVTTPYSPGVSERAGYAVYVDDGLGIRAVGLCDLGFAAYAGGALGLLPAGGAQDAVADQLLSAAMEENLYEVLNICAALLNAEGHPHVRLHAVHGPMVAPPAEVATLGEMLGRRLDLTVDVAGYGAGRFSMICLG